MENLKKLIDVKSIVTILLTVAFIYLSATQKLTNDFLTVYTVVISFYFGTQHQKRTQELQTLEDIEILTKND